MGQDRAGHRGHRQPGANRRQRRDEQQQRRDQLDHARTNPSPRLGVNRGEDVDRLLGRCELEEQRLEQDDGDRDLGDPGDGGLKSGEVVHAAWMTRKPRGFTGIEAHV